MKAKKFSTFLLFVLVIGSAFVSAETRSVVILYTSDMHDYIKPGPDDLGGMPYIAGYISSLRSKRDDMLILDGGDVMEKGDMVAFKTKSQIMYEVMGKIGYSAGALGNHDLAYGIEHLKHCAAIAKMEILCLNYLDAHGKPYFPASKIFTVNGVSVGVIGLTNIKGGPYLDFETCGRHLAEEAARLKRSSHLVVVIAHIGSADLAKLSVMAPEVDILFGAHTHEVLKEPRIVPETGKIIVMAGHYARYVAQVDLQVDTEKSSITSYQMSLIEMSHKGILPDTQLLAWINEEEKIHCPEATETIGITQNAILPNDMARIAANAIKWFGNADIAFCHPGQIMRSNLPVGEINPNLLFRTGGQRGHDLVKFHLTGEQIAAYVVGLLQDKRGRTEWAGFNGKIHSGNKGGTWILKSDLDSQKSYSVIMPYEEWKTRFSRVARENPLLAQVNPPEEVTFTFTDALVAYVKNEVTSRGQSLDEHLTILR